MLANSILNLLNQCYQSYKGYEEGNIQANQGGYVGVDKLAPLNSSNNSLASSNNSLDGYAQSGYLVEQPSSSRYGDLSLTAPSATNAYAKADW